MFKLSLLFVAASTLALVPGMVLDSFSTWPKNYSNQKKEFSVLKLGLKLSKIKYSTESLE